jgi:hypothetical protein
VQNAADELLRLGTKRSDSALRDQPGGGFLGPQGVSTRDLVQRGCALELIPVFFRRLLLGIATVSL